MTESNIASPHSNIASRLKSAIRVAPVIVVL